MISRRGYEKVERLVYFAGMCRKARLMERGKDVLGMGDREEIQSLFDLMDFEEGRRS